MFFVFACLRLCLVDSCGSSGSRYSLFVLGCFEVASDRVEVFLFSVVLLGRSEVVYVVQVVPRCFL